MKRDSRLAETLDPDYYRNSHNCYHALIPRANAMQFLYLVSAQPVQTNGTPPATDASERPHVIEGMGIDAIRASPHDALPKGPCTIYQGPDIPQQRDPSQGLETLEQISTYMSPSSRMKNLHVTHHPWNENA